MGKTQDKELDKSVKKNVNVVEKKEYNKTLLMIAVILVFIIVVIVIFTFGYAKYITTKTGSATTEVANMVCEMQVDASEANREIINPYCMVEVKNYNDTNGITETDVNYKIEVTAKEGYTLPQYYWQETDGTTIAYDTAVTGSFTHGSEQTKTYKIVFANSGEQDITQIVDFNLVAIQAE